MKDNDYNAIQRDWERKWGEQPQIPWDGQTDDPHTDLYSVLLDPASTAREILDAYGSYVEDVGSADEEVLGDVINQLDEIIK